jgi:hypothetical protein
MAIPLLCALVLEAVSERLYTAAGQRDLSFPCTSARYASASARVAMLATRARTSFFFSGYRKLSWRFA